MVAGVVLGDLVTVVEVNLEAKLLFTGIIVLLSVLDLKVTEVIEMCGDVSLILISCIASRPDEGIISVVDPFYFAPFVSSFLLSRRTSAVSSARSLMSLDFRERSSRKIAYDFIISPRRNCEPVFSYQSDSLISFIIEPTAFVAI